MKNVVCAIVVSIVFLIHSNAVAQNRFDPIEHPVQVGIVLDQMILRYASSSNNSFRIPTALVLKHYFHSANSFNVYVSYDAREGLSYYNPESKYRYSGFKIQAAYEHAFFVPKRLNLLTGAKLGYVYSRNVLDDFAYDNVRYPNLLKFHSRLGPGADIGVRFNATKRLGLESNIGFIYTWSMPYNESFKSWKRDGEFSFDRAISLELYYRFGK